MECPFFCVGTNGSYTTLGHNTLFNNANYLHESGTAAHRIRTADTLKIRVIRCVFYSI